MITYLYIVQIILSIVLVFVVLLQSKGSVFGGAFGGDSSAYRSRRGVEKTLFNFTILLAAVFVLICIATVKFYS